MLEEVQVSCQSNEIWVWLEVIAWLTWAMLRLEGEVFGATNGANENGFETYIIAILF